LDTPIIQETSSSVEPNNAETAAESIFRAVLELVVTSDKSIENAVKAVVAYVQQTPPTTYASVATNGSAEASRISTKAELNIASSSQLMAIREVLPVVYADFRGVYST